MKVFALFDSKTSAFGIPFFIEHKGQALREFEQMANNPESYVSKYPGDFTLFELGDYDKESAKFTFHKAPLSLGVAVEFSKSSASVPTKKELNHCG